MRFFDQEILEELEKIPTPNCPGSIVVTGESQAVLTGKNPGEVIIAAAQIRRGRIIVTAHDCFISWLNQDNSELKNKFNRNLKLWLVGEDICSSEIVDFKDASRATSPFTNYKLIQWQQNFNPSEEDIAKLLKWLKVGGGLICSFTPWGYLQLNPKKNLNDLEMFRFLKEHTGIIFTSEILSLPNEVSVCQNRAKHSHFDYAFERVIKNPEKLVKYCSTIDKGIFTVTQEGVLDKEKISNFQQLLEQNSNMIVPSSDKPIKTCEEKAVVNLIGKCLVCIGDQKAPGVHDFPGDFEVMPELLENIDLQIETRFGEWVSTGYYLPAGINLKAKIEGNLNGWSIRIGAHSDNIENCDFLTRWPCITVTKDLANEMTLCSPFGGLVYFESTRSGSIKVSLTNVVTAPYFDLTKPETIKNWNERKNAPGLWAEIAGENIIFTTPSCCIRHIENPTDIVKFWDQVVETHHQCRGTRVKNYRRERVVNDRQPSAGYMHSGYPIVTHLDCCQKDHEECIFDLEKLSANGNWGLFHELGHNMQRNQWTFEGTEEVTVNIFSLHATFKVIGQDILDQKWPRGQMSHFQHFFSKELSFEDFKNNCGMALMLFVSLIKYFGWNSMYTFMKNYEVDIEFRKNLPKSEQDKIDQWVLRYSQIVSRNLKPHFEMFGVPVSEEVDNKLSDLELWCVPGEKDPSMFFKKL